MSATPAGFANEGGDEHFFYVPDPAMPGWMTWDPRDATRFNALLGPLRLRREDDGRARLRMVPLRAHTNVSDVMHGGALMGLIDVALFATCRARGIAQLGIAVTLDCGVQFIAPVRADRAVDAVGEVLRETARLVFVRGLVVQGDGADETVCAAFSGTIRKAPRER